MFVRIKTTPNSPRKSVQIVASLRKGDKVTQKIVRYVGIAMDDAELVQLTQLAEVIKAKMEDEATPSLFSADQLSKLNKNAQETERLKVLNEEGKHFQVDLRDLEEEDRVVEGIHEVYGALYEQLGLSEVFEVRTKRSAELFREIVLARVARPLSKLGTVNYLERQFAQQLDVNAIYRMMDQLDERRIHKLKAQIYKETRSLFAQKLDVLFFDVTTLYYESFEEDGFRNKGYSKDMKFNQPQVVLALMVTKEGLPVGYEVFPGDTYEGHTFIPCLKELKEKYGVNRVIFVADSGMCNKANLDHLEAEGFEYIIGARLKGQTQQVTDQILSDQYLQINSNEAIQEIAHHKGRLIVHYAKDRARKNAGDRRRAIEKLRHKLNTKSAEKPGEKSQERSEGKSEGKGLRAIDLLSNYGYKKYLKEATPSKFVLDEAKILEDAKWDGLLGVISNAKDLDPLALIRQYQQLWTIEDAFRIHKHQLAIRPVYHFKKERIKAHIAICFAAFTLMMHLRHRIKLQQAEMSINEVREELLCVQSSIYYHKKTKIRYRMPGKLSDRAKKIYKEMGINRFMTPRIISA